MDDVDEWVVVHQRPDEAWTILEQDGETGRVLYISPDLTILPPGTPGGIELSCPATIDTRTNGITGPVRLMVSTPRPRAHVTVQSTGVVRSTLSDRTWPLEKLRRATKARATTHATSTRRVRYDHELNMCTFSPHQRIHEKNFTKAAPADHCFVRCDAEWIPPEWLRLEI